MKLLARIAILLYPRAWRDRYGEELAALVEDSGRGWLDVIDVTKGGIVMQLRNGRTLAAIGAALAAATVVVIVGSVLFSLEVVMQGTSMEPSFGAGNRVGLTRDVASLDRGDVVAFQYPLNESKTFVKRIVALPGETIEIRNGQVLVDGKVLSEAYVTPMNRSVDDLGPLRLRRDYFFVLGDNRRNSTDSRHWGPVQRKHIVAKVSE
jgi:signal peptidase I